MEELITLSGTTPGDETTSGELELKSQIIHGSVTRIRIPKGLKLKIWCKRISGDPAKIMIQYTRDVTVTTPTWEDLIVEELTSPGEVVLEKRRPAIVYGMTGKEAVRVYFDQSAYGAGTTTAEVEVELTDE